MTSPLLYTPLSKPFFGMALGMGHIPNQNNKPMTFIRENARLLATLVVGFVNYLLADNFDPAAGENFFTYFFENFSFTLGMLFPLLAGYIGERRLIAIEPNTTLTGIVAVVTVLLPLLAEGIDWTSLIGVINIFAESGQLTFGAILGVLTNYFSDIRVGRPQAESAKVHAKLVRFNMWDLPRILVYGRVNR